MIGWGCVGKTLGGSSQRPEASKSPCRVKVVALGGLGGGGAFSLDLQPIV